MVPGVSPDRPPSTARIVPVMYDASSDARKATAAAISDGSAWRASGVAATTGAVRDSSSGGKPATGARATQAAGARTGGAGGAGGSPGATGAGGDAASGGKPAPAARATQLTRIRRRRTREP